jgi:hypothetical protein
MTHKLVSNMRSGFRAVSDVQFVSNSDNGESGAIPLSSKASNGPSGAYLRPDFFDFLLAKFRGGATFFGHVHRIVFVGSDHKVIGVDAPSVIAGVHNNSTASKLNSFIDMRRNSVRAYWVLIKAHLTVSVASDAAGPFPASGRPFNEAMEAATQRAKKHSFAKWVCGFAMPAFLNKFSFGHMVPQ